MTNPERVYHLLVVDDDAVDRRRYGRLLAHHAHYSFDIRHAEDGAAGLAALRAGGFDCVLVNFELPDMTGLQFLAHLAADREHACAVILVTGRGGEAIAVEAMQRGVQDCLVKDDVNTSSLSRAIVNAVTQTELRRSLAESRRDLTAVSAALEQEVMTRSAAEADARAAKDAAEQASQARTRFVARVTHELRTPLSGILGYAELLQIEGGLSARQADRVAAMRQAGRHLLVLTQQVLDVAGTESEHLQLHPVPVPVQELAEECIALVGAMLGQRPVSLRLSIAYDAPRRIVADPARLRQVVLNLLGNAVKYTDSRSVQLRVLPGAMPGGLRIEVADTGAGLDASAGDRLLRDVERLHTGSHVPGTGLGLAIAAHIVRGMRGTIGHAPNPGGGTVFWLELPTAAAPSSAPPAVPFASGRSVLLVDDIAINRDVIGAFLRAAGHAVVLAESGDEALRLAFEQSFDLILMDVRMPRMDGLEATRRIRALPSPVGQVPILALTAHSFPTQVAQCRDAGMGGHIAKPVDSATLMAAIDDAIAGAPPRWSDQQPRPATARAQLPAILDRAVLDCTLAVLPSDEAAGFLRSLRARMQETLSLFDRDTAPALRAEAAHTLAAAAAMFGFAALSAAARGFEHATGRDAAATGAPLCAQIHVALAALDDLLQAGRMQLA